VKPGDDAALQIPYIYCKRFCGGVSVTSKDGSAFYLFLSGSCVYTVKFYIYQRFVILYKIKYIQRGIINMPKNLSLCS